MAVALSNSGDDVMTRQIALNSQLSFTNTAAEFDVSSTANWICEHKFRRVAVQLPDELMGASVTVVQLLQQTTTAEIVILADTSYGSCCVDEVAAEHYSVDAIVHYGHACLSPLPGKLPVHFVLGRQPVDMDQLISAVSTCITDHSQPVLLLYDTIYHHAVVNGLRELLMKVFVNLTVPGLALPQSGSVQTHRTDDTHVQFGRVFGSSVLQHVSDYTVLYIGCPESRFLTAVLMTFAGCRCVAHNPETNESSEITTKDSSKALARRFYLVERARDAQRVGILIGTLGVAKHLDIASQLEATIRRAGKSVYRFVVGKPNTAKLANFADIDIFVLIACPENSLLDSKEFFQPIVTPFEMELACNPQRQWTGKCELDFHQLLPGGSSHCKMSDVTEEHTDVSLVTGKLRHTGLSRADDDNTSSLTDAVVKRNEQMPVVENSASSVLVSRSWQGLDPQLGKTPVDAAVQGAVGLAMGYRHELQDSKPHHNADI